MRRCSLIFRPQTEHVSGETMSFTFTFTRLRLCMESVAYLTVLSHTQEKSETLHGFLDDAILEE